MSRASRAGAATVVALLVAATWSGAAHAGTTPAGPAESTQRVESQAYSGAGKASGCRYAVGIWGQPKFNGIGVGMDPDRDYRNLRNYSVALPKDKNWNNRISSIIVPSNCQVKLFAKKNFRGHETKWLEGRVPRLGKVPDSGDNWNNAATSIKIRRK